MRCEAYVAHLEVTAHKELACHGCWFIKESLEIVLLLCVYVVGLV